MTWYISSPQNKFRSRKTVVGGIKYDSKKEGNYANDLALLKRAGEIKDWSPKPRYDLVVNGKKICSIIPDFLITRNDDSLELHEVKSTATMTPTWSLKRKLFEALYPEIVYRIIL